MLQVQLPTIFCKDLVEELDVVLYHPLAPEEASQPPSLQQWLHQMRQINGQCAWLLSLPFEAFWSQFLFAGNSGELMKMMDSYLENCPRPYETILFKNNFYNENKEVIQVQSTLHKLVLLILLRLGSPKEFKENNISDDANAEAIKQSGVFDVPRLMDIASLYGHCNGELISKMLEKVVAMQPKYRSSLGLAGKTSVSRLEDVQSQINSLRFMSAVTDDLTLSHVLDIIRFLVDFVFTLKYFLRLLPAACSPFYEEGLMDRLPHFVETFLPRLRQHIGSLQKNCFDMTYYEGQVGFIEAEFIEIFRALLQTCCLEPIFGKSCKHREDCLERFLESISNLSCDMQFLSLYSAQYPFYQDSCRLRSVAEELGLDVERLDYIAQGISASLGRKATVNPATFLPHEQQNGSGPELEDNPSKFSKDPDMVPNANDPAPENLLSMVSHIREVLGGVELKDHFIRACLKHFDYDLEETVNGILCETLPDAFSRLRFAEEDPIDESYSSYQAQREETCFSNFLDRPVATNAEAGGSSRANGPVSGQDTSIAASERTIANNPEEYSQVDQESDGEPTLTRLTKSKKRGHQNEDFLLEKDEVQTMKSFYARHAYETPSWFVDEDGVERLEEGYEDDYDDTYELHQVAAGDADSADEMTDMVLHHQRKGQSSGLRATAPIFEPSLNARSRVPVSSIKESVRASRPVPPTSSPGPNGRQAPSKQENRPPQLDASQPPPASRGSNWRTREPTGVDNSHNNNSRNQTFPQPQRANVGARPRVNRGGTPNMTQNDADSATDREGSMAYPRREKWQPNNNTDRLGGKASYQSDYGNGSDRSDRTKSIHSNKMEDRNLEYSGWSKGFIPEEGAYRGGRQNGDNFRTFDGDKVGSDSDAEDAETFVVQPNNERIGRVPGGAKAGGAGRGRGRGGSRGCRGGAATAEDLRTRQGNERHKGQRANHNRKAMAAKKQQRGGFV